MEMKLIEDAKLAGEIEGRAARIFDLTASLPGYVFRSKLRSVTFIDFDWMFTADIWEVLHELLSYHGDSALRVMSIIPHWSSYNETGWTAFPIAEIPASSTPEQYIHALRIPFRAGRIDSLDTVAERIAWFGLGGGWGVYGERSLATAIVGSNMSESPVRFPEKFAATQSAIEALDVRLSMSFKGGVVPAEFVRQFRENYGR